MTRKERILRMVQRQDDDVSYDRVMYHLDVMKHIEEGMDDIKQGRVIDHDEVFDELLKEDAKNQDRLDRESQKRSARNSATHRAGSKPKKSRGVRKPIAKHG